MEKNKQILIIDINYLPSEYKDKTTQELQKEFKKLYKMSVLIIDGSRVNTQSIGGVNYQPIYII